MQCLPRYSVPCYTMQCNAMQCLAPRCIRLIRNFHSGHCNLTIVDVHFFKYICNACVKHHKNCESCPVSLFNNCKVTMIVMNSSSQLSEMLTISYMFRNQVMSFLCVDFWPFLGTFKHFLESVFYLSTFLEQIIFFCIFSTFRATWPPFSRTF